MNNNKTLYEMSNRTLELDHNNEHIRLLENLQQNNGFQSSVVGEISNNSTSEIVDVNKINNPSTSSNNLNHNNSNFANINHSRPALDDIEEEEEENQPVKQCVVVLQRSQTVEAAWQREQLRRQARLSLSPPSTATTTKPGASAKESHSKKRPVLPSCVERCEAGFICQLCKKTYPGRTSFMQHIRSEHSSTCDVCAKVLSSTQKLKDHLRFVHGKSQTSWEQKLFSSTLKFSCTFCHKIFGSQSSLDKHTIFKHSNMDLESSQSQNEQDNNIEHTYKCEFCEDKYDSKLKLRGHIYEKHIDEEEDNEQLDDTQLLSAPSSSAVVEKSKIITPSGPPVTAYECPHCLTLHANKDRFKKHLGFKWPESFSEHQVKIDPQVLARQKEAVTCEVCGARAANLAFLHTHQSSHPELDRPHSCPNPCNRKFLFRCQLDRHALIHQVGAPIKSKHNSEHKQQQQHTTSQGGGRYRCTVCSKRTRSEARLLAHISCCHKGNLEYRCKICDICFPSSKSLGRHCNKKEHNVHNNIEENNEPWVSPETPSNINTVIVNHTQSVRPDSLGSSDSVSTSDAFSMYFQSLHSLGSLDMALDIDNNQSIFDDVIPLRNNETSNVILHGRPAVTEVTEIVNTNDNNIEIGNELQFHTLQTVPIEPLSELEATYLQNMKVEPLSQIDTTTSNNMDVQVPNDEIFDDIKSEPMETEKTYLPTPETKPPVLTIKLEPTVTPSVPVQENTTTELSQLESFLVLQQDPYPINIDDICNANDVIEKSPPLISSPVIETPVNIIKTEKLEVDDIKMEVDLKTIDHEEINYETNIIKEEINTNTSDLIIKNDVNESITTNVIKYLPPELNDTECNIHLLADTCDSSSLSNIDNNSSLSSSDSNKNKVYKKQISNCSDCGKIFSSAHSASRHAKLSCPGRDPKTLQISCPQCSLILADRKELHKHKREIHPDTLFTCNACSKTFFLAQSLARHQKESCSHREIFPCRQCKVLLPSVEELRVHTSEKHPGVLATCEICGKTLSSAQSLRRHLRSHKPDELGNVDVKQEDSSTNKTVKKKKKSDIECIEDTFDIKTDDSKDCESQVGSLADDLLSDFASISTNQLFNGNLNNGELLQEEFNISDMFLIKNGALQCDFCEASFLTDKLLLQHLSSQHFPNTQWQPAQPQQQQQQLLPASTNSATMVTASTSTQNNMYDLPSTSY